MPKERIYLAHGEHNAVVGWDPLGYVQIGIEGAGDYDEEVTPRPQLWADLSRHEINALIRVLRKARDAAFGRDE